jgi:hypothetical protein
VRLRAAFPLCLATCVLPARAPKDSSGGGVPAEQDVTAWRSWPRANDKRFESKGHGFLWVDIRVAPGFEKDYAALNVTAPAGFRIVKVGYEAQTGGEPVGLTMMAKMPAGYDAPNGDWFYAALAPDAKRASVQGKLDPCIACHENAPGGHDHLFGVTPED